MELTIYRPNDESSDVTLYDKCTALIVHCKM